MVTPGQNVGERRMSRILTNRPIVVMTCCSFEIRDRLAVVNCRRGRGVSAGAGCNSAGRSNQVTVPHDDLVDDALGSILWSELALLDGALDENVLALFECQRDLG